MKYNHKHFGKNLRHMLKHKGYSQKIFAKRAEISESDLSLILSGQRRPHLETLCAILNALGGPAFSIFCGTDRWE